VRCIGISGQIVVTAGWSRKQAGSAWAAAEEIHAGEAPGEPALIGGRYRIFSVCAGLPNLFHLMLEPGSTPKTNFRILDAAVVDALQIFAVGFAGTACTGIVVKRPRCSCGVAGVITNIAQAAACGACEGQAFISESAEC